MDKYGQLIIVVMTHGCHYDGHNYLMARDKKYPVGKIWNYLHHPGLTGKPKLMFIQGCRKIIRKKKQDSSTRATVN